MRITKILTLLLAGVLPLSVYALVAQTTSLEPIAEHSRATAEIVSRLQNQHYQRTSVYLDDRLSNIIFDTYLNELDPDHSYFLQSDVDEFSSYRTKLDDAIKTGNLKPGFDIFNRYQQRLTDRLELLLKAVDQDLEKMDFTRDEYLDIDRENAPWAKSQAELDELWRKRIKNDVLNQKMDGKDFAQIREALHKRYSNRLNLIRQTHSEDAYNYFINAFTSSYDPHTQYLSPEANENFNIQMRLSLEGIGAMLQTEDEYTKVMQVIPGGPADKSGQLKTNDRIIGVGQDAAGEIIDVIGWRLDDVVKLIRGKKNTTVRLQILPGNSADIQQSKVISLVRDMINLEDRAASKEVLELSSYGKNYRIGVVTIPKFYFDFEAAERGDPNFRSSTRDVRKLLKALVAEKVDGIVIDLRGNGGGALREAIDLTGLFIEQGPAVQVRNISGRVDLHEDRNPEIAYSGPLAVLVNRLSASASEIFAGAIQDYNRGIVIGTQTYGKGTVQAKLPLSYGEITLTQQKFYRITGDSTQNRGVIPDISLPSLYNVKEVGESALKNAMPWDRIRSVRFDTWPDFSSTVPRLTELHQQRSSKNPDYIHLIKSVELIEQRRSIKKLSLNEAARREDKAQLEQQQLTLENERRRAKGLALAKNYSELEKHEDEVPPEDGASKEEQPLLTESAYILIDYINLNKPRLANH